MTPWAAISPPVRSAIGSPARSGPWPGKPLTVMKPESPWAIWSRPARSAYGPACPNPEMLT